MLDRMELDPSFLIGGVVEGYGTNGKNGDGEYFVVEADESDSSFLYLCLLYTSLPRCRDRFARGCPRRRVRRVPR